MSTETNPYFQHTGHERPDILEKIARMGLQPFYQYVKSALDSIRKREAVKARWEKISQERFKLKLKGQLCRLPKALFRLSLKAYSAPWFLLQSTDGKALEKDLNIPLLVRFADGAQESFVLQESTMIEVNDCHYLVRLENMQRDAVEQAIWGFNTSLELRPNRPKVGRGDQTFQLFPSGQTMDYLNFQKDSLFVAKPLKGETSFVKIHGALYELEAVREQSSTIPTNAHILREESDARLVYAPQNTKSLSSYALNREEEESFLAALFQRTEGLNYDGKKVVFTDKALQKQASQQKEIHLNGLAFEVKSARDRDEQYQIQLEELEEDSQSIFSPLRFFFDDGIEVSDSKRNNYQIFRGNEEDFKLILKDRNGNTCFPKGTVLSVRINNYPLKMQMQAIRTLQNMPVADHLSLLKLLEKQEVVSWPNTYSPSSGASLQASKQLDWEVLTDAERSGSQEQRAFVQKALATQDFAFLEGPPGSGKTTVILELICQLVQQGKRILLCGSTHVAIDNVLERLKVAPNGENLLSKYAILPIRIGDQSRLSAEIREFQLDNMLEADSIGENLLLEAANLVCGTTIGILQHPHFKARDARNEPITPDFDYLIIDECSKTTFQEFLVPALYAKRWVLVGDNMQLAPYTDRDELQSGIEHIPLKNNKPLPEALQRSCFILHHFFDQLNGKGKFWKEGQGLFIPVPKSAFSYLKEELEARKFHSPALNLGNFNLLSETQPNLNSLELDAQKNWLVGFIRHDTPLEQCNPTAISCYDVIFYDEEIPRSSLAAVLPETFLIVDDQLQDTAAVFRHNYSTERLQYGPARSRGKTEERGWSLQKELLRLLKEKSWAEEITWRIDREHQLRLKEGKTEHYRRTIKELLPKSLPPAEKRDLENRINTVASVGLPSILESLLEGLRGQRKDVETVITKGFGSADLLPRREKLLFQHRMHPEISAFPREQFYTKDDGIALQDLRYPSPIEQQRQWVYNRYASRSVWIDVKGSPHRNENAAEADKMLEELKAFVQYAHEYTPPEKAHWQVACLSFYRGQERLLRKLLRKYCNQPNSFSSFQKDKVRIKLHTVDKFQGQEADIVFLSMVQTYRDGFLDNPNRLNVAITRARFQLVILGSHHYFSRRSRSEDLKALAQKTYKI